MNAIEAARTMANMQKFCASVSMDRISPNILVTPTIPNPSPSEYSPQWVPARWTSRREIFMDLIRILKQSRGSALGLGMAGLLLGACGLTACQTQQQQVQQREDLLSAAGFIVRPANT